ncbi:hypothetical protein PN462_18875 [Spirulina sp. CS-785/01]|uniref:hypothetical protein n=1 Tax=Spirulina sp. CS-785/01 TaxID=3021716 RepID=UPI002330873D|nr:hypothetical protein [Spirulina sp. CS-785/01]MDB9315186.1 hypothetical protein [Spirulina sp. CS-785/01]
MKQHLWKKTILVWLNLGIVLLFLSQAVLNNTYIQKNTQDFNNYLAQLSEEFPQEDPNSAALELQKLALPLGMDIAVIPPRQEVSIPPQNKEEWQKVDSQLYDYLDTVVTSQEDTIPPLSQDLQNYLHDHREDLDKIRQKVLQVEHINWGRNYDFLTVNHDSPLPKFWGLIQLLRLLIVEAIERNLEGDFQTAFTNLEVVFKLNQSIRNQPELYAQITSLVADRYLAAVFRKSANLPQISQKELLTLKRFSILKSLKIDTAIRHYFDLANPSYPARMRLSNNPLIDRFLFIFYKPYLRFALIESWQSSNRALNKLEKADFCTIQLNQQEFADLPELQRLWWITHHYDFHSHKYNVWLKFARLKLEWELTEKVQKIKTVAQKQGQFPDEIVGIEQSMCDESRWVYEVDAQGKASIHLEGIPPAIRERDARDEDEVPLAYNF